MTRIRQQQEFCPDGTVYTIRRGDTLYTIANRFDFTVAQLMAANPGLNPRNLQIGQQICIPSAAGPGTCPGGRSYSIGPGDTFYRLAQRFNVRLEDLLAANPGVNPDQLQVGQRVCIPGVAPPSQEIGTPCAVALSMNPEAGLPPIVVAGSVMFSRPRNAPRNIAIMTVAAVGLVDLTLPEGMTGYVGSVVIAQGAGEPPLRFSVPLRRCPAEPSEGSVPVWAGSRQITAVPSTSDRAEIRMANLDSGQLGEILLFAGLGGCQD